MDGMSSALAVYQQHLQMVYRIAYTYLQNRSEAENAAQEVFVRLFRGGVELSDEQAVRAKLAAVTTAICLKKINDPSYKFKADDNPHEIDSVMSAVMSLPGKYKTVVYLFYCEGLTAAETAQYMGDDIEVTRSIIGKSRRSLTAKIGNELDCIAQSYDKIRIDANAAVRIWKNILTIGQAISAMLAKQRGEEPTVSVPPTFPVAEIEDEDDEDGEMPNPFASVMADDGEEEPVPDEDESDDEDDEDYSPAPSADEEDEEEVRIFVPKREAEREAEETAEYSEEVAAEETSAESTAPPEAEESFDWDTLTAPETDAESDGDEYEEEAPASHEGGAHASGRSSRRRRRRAKSIIPSVLIGAAIALAAAFALFMLIRGRESGTSSKSGTGLSTNSDISVAVVTARPVEYEGPKQSVDKITEVQTALSEWDAYRNAEKQKYVEEKMPSFADFMQTDDYFDGTDVVENGDGTYSFIHWNYVQDWGNTVISPVTGMEEPTVIQKFDYENSVTVEEDEYNNYVSYMQSRETEGVYGEYNYSYGVANEAEGKKLEEIAAAHSLSVRKDAGERFGIEDTSNAELEKTLTLRAGHGPIYTSTPEIDYICFYESGAFESMAEIRLTDGRRMYTLLCATPYTEMIDALAANGITQLDNADMEKRSYKSADGTELTIAQNEKQAIFYAYFDDFYVVADLGINAWRESPVFGDTEEQRAAKVETNLTITDEVVNFVADSINFNNIGD